MFQEKSKDFLIDGRKLTVVLGQLFDMDGVPGKYFVISGPSSAISIEQRTLDTFKLAQQLLGIFEDQEKAVECFNDKCEAFEKLQNSKA